MAKKFTAEDAESAENRCFSLRASALPAIFRTIPEDNNKSQKYGAISENGDVRYCLV